MTISRWRDHRPHQRWQHPDFTLHHIAGKLHHIAGKLHHIAGKLHHIAGKLHTYIAFDLYTNITISARLHDTSAIAAPRLAQDHSRHDEGRLILIWRQFPAARIRIIVT
jgi:hypothetical protein